jgi:prepilin-type N-terminal cleavage/methylation domain-containing protein
MEDMNDKSLGARSKGKTLFISRHRGFSLVEVLMSIVLIAIGTALALPSYRDQVEKRQVTNGAEQIASFINAAQGAAMKTNREVWVSWTRNSANEWCIGANVTEACNCTQDNACQVGGQEFVIDNSSAGNRDLLQSISGGGIDNAYGFDPVRGLILDQTDAPVMQLSSNSDDFRLSISVNSTGRVTLCSTDSEHAVPGYDVCQPSQEVQVAEGK